MNSSVLHLKVLFLIRSLGFGGAERQLSYVAEGLVKFGHEVCVAVYYLDGPYLAELRHAGVRVASLEKRGRWDLISFAWRLWRFIRCERPDVVYGFMPTENLAVLLISRLLRPHIPVVWGIRASDVDAAIYGPLSAAVYKLQERLVHAPDLVISNSHAALVNLGIAANPHHAAVIPNGIDVSRFRPDTELRRVGRAALGIADDRPVVALVGRLDPMKGHESFLRAAALASTRLHDALFLIVGSGSQDYRRSQTEIATQLGIVDRVIWHNATVHIETIYNAADVLVSSSAFGEGFPNVVAEAMACGTPVVATDVGDTARVVGPHGTIVPRNDPQALAAGIVEALANRSPRSAAARRRWVVDEFSIDKLVASTQAALAALAGPKAS